MNHPNAAQNTEQIAVSIVSNSQLLRDGLLALLAGHISLRLVGSYAGDPIPDGFENPPGHIVLLDSGIGRDNSLAWTSFCRSLPEPARVLILELVNDIELIVSCIEAGANGYTLQGASPAEVSKAIQQVNAGVAQCSPEVTARLFARLAALGSARLPALAATTPLTTRELEVLDYVARGFSNKEIADALVIELRTVKQHVHNILDKLKVSRRQEAARFAREQGWVSESQWLYKQ